MPQVQSSALGAVEQLAESLLNQPGVKDKLLSLLFERAGGLISRLLHRSKSDPAVAIGAPVSPAGVPDEPIAPPPHLANPKVASVRLVLSRAQYSRKLFPEMYTDENPDGMYLGEDLQRIRSGGNISRESKVWFDVTAFDEAGQEFTPSRVVAAGLEYQTEFWIEAAGLTHVKGVGAAADSTHSNPKPAPGYIMDQGGFMGCGAQAWIATRGFLLQLKAYGEGPGEARAAVAGIESGKVSFSVS